MGIGFPDVFTINAQTSIYDIIRPDGFFLFFPVWLFLWVLINIVDIRLPLSRVVARALCWLLRIRRPEGFIPGLDAVSLLANGWGKLSPGHAHASGVVLYHPDFVDAWNQKSTAYVEHGQPRVAPPIFTVLGRAIVRLRVPLLIGAALTSLFAVVGGGLAALESLSAAERADRNRADAAATRQLYTAMMAGEMPSDAVCQRTCGGNEHCLSLACIPDPGEDAHRFLPGWYGWEPDRLEGVAVRCPTVQVVYEQLGSLKEWRHDAEQARTMYGLGAAGAALLLVVSAGTGAGLMISLIRSRRRRSHPSP